MDYFAYDKCLLRISSYPVENIVDFFEITGEIDLQDPVAIKQALVRLFNDDFFKKAIFISSNEVYKLIEDSISDKVKDIKILKRTLLTTVKYYSRMCSRPTPYGLFAGTAYAKISSDPTVIHFDKERFKVDAQFNLFAVTKLIRELAFEELGVNESVLYKTNNTLYIKGNRILYVEQVEKNGSSISKLSSIVLNKYTETAVIEAKKGITIDELIGKLPDEGISHEKKLKFLHSLIKNQVLVSDLLPSTYTKNFVEDLLGKFQKYGLHKLHSQLQLMNNSLTRKVTLESINLDDSDLKTQSLFTDTNDLIKTDLYINLDQRNVNNKVIEHISQTSYELLQFAPKERKSEELSLFIKRFQEKYEDKVVPLCEAIDSTFGVGYGLMASGIAEYMPLLDDVLTTQELDTRQGRSNKHSLLSQEVFKEYLLRSNKSIDIEKYLQKYQAKNSEDKRNLVTSSTAIFGSLIVDSVSELDKLNYKFIPVLSHAPGAMRMVSRFVNGQEEISLLAQQIVQDEQMANSNTVLAEVTTIPDGKYANITLCSAVRNYEIPYISNSNANDKNQISINDLSIIIRDGKVVLWSSVLQKTIMPCFSNSYNIRNATPLLQFLADVSIQGLTFGYEWNWGEYYQEPHLPRIEYKNFILCRERWFVKKQDLDYANIEVVQQYIASLRLSLNMPKYMVVSEGDNELLIDLDNVLCVIVLAKEISQRNVVLYEYLHTPENCLIKGEVGSYASSLLITMGTANPMPVPYIDSKVFTSSYTPRVFAPGSEWLYVKIYGGNKLLEAILSEVVLPFAELVTGEGTIDQWFYIRYSDPNPHVRVRFHQSGSDTSWNSLLARFSQAVNDFVDDEFAVRIVVDTYYQEIERYGEQNITHCEAVFHADSIAVSKFISLVYGDEGEVLRWKFALVNITSLLEDFGYTLEASYDLIEELSDDFLLEFSTGQKGKANLIKALNAKYRSQRNEIETLMHGNMRSAYSELHNCFEDRSHKLSKIAPHFSSLNETTKGSIVKSLIHMSLNRTFLSNQRKHELVIYHFLKSYYKSNLKKSILKS